MRTGPKIQWEKLTVFGKYLDDALTLAGMSRAELARRSNIQASFVTRVFKEKRTVGRDTLLLWCEIMQCPDWLEERILNAAGYASRQQMERVERPEAVEEAHRIVQEELKRKK